MSPTLQADSLLAELPGKPTYTFNKYLFYVLVSRGLTIVVYIPLTYSSFS